MRINLEVAGVNDDAKRGMHGERHGIHDGVRDLDGMNRERAELEALSRHHLVQLRVFQQAVLFQFVFHVGEGELGGIDGHVELGDQPWDAADVVFMPVGEQNAANLVAVFNQVSEGGNDDIHAEQLVLREHHSGVDDDDVIVPADGHAVHSELAQATERHNVKFSGWHKP